jgi:hypothetical protein
MNTLGRGAARRSIRDHLIQIADGIADGLPATAN